MTVTTQVGKTFSFKDSKSDTGFEFSYVVEFRANPEVLVIYTETGQYDSARIYFEYPRSISSLLADNVGLIVPAENTQQDVYTVTVQGNKNRFYFKSDGIIRAVMHHPIKNFEVKRKIQS